MMALSVATRLSAAHSSPSMSLAAGSYASYGYTITRLIGPEETYDYEIATNIKHIIQGSSMAEYGGWSPGRKHVGLSGL